MGWNRAKWGSKCLEGRAGSWQRYSRQLLRAVGGSSQPCFSCACVKTLERQPVGKTRGCEAAANEVFALPLHALGRAVWQTLTVPVSGLIWLSLGPAQSHIKAGTSCESGLHNAVRSSLQCLCYMWCLVSCWQWSVSPPERLPRSVPKQCYTGLGWLIGGGISNSRSREPLLGNVATCYSGHLPMIYYYFFFLVKTTGQRCYTINMK